MATNPRRAVIRVDCAGRCQEAENRGSRSFPPATSTHRCGVTRQSETPLPIARWDLVAQLPAVLAASNRAAFRLYLRSSPLPEAEKSVFICGDLKRVDLRTRLFRFVRLRLQS